METKVCTKCLCEKHISEFYRRKDRKSGFISNCKSCTKTSRKEAWKELPEHIKEQRNLQKRLNHANNLNRDRENRRRYRLANPEKVGAWCKEYRQRNKDKILSSQKEHWRNNKDRLIEQRRNRRQARRSLDPIYSATLSARSLISTSFIRKGWKKKSKTEAILGCSYADFKNHIEQQFLPGMTWDNRSEWHIDHIIPIASAKTEEDVLKLNHYTNLRPLWAADNIRKGAKIAPEWGNI